MVTGDVIFEVQQDGISIHTTTQVVTLQMIDVFLLFGISIHTTTQVVTGPSEKKYSCNKISIHTTTQVVTARAV